MAIDLGDLGYPVFFGQDQLGILSYIYPVKFEALHPCDWAFPLQLDCSQGWSVPNDPRSRKMIKGLGDWGDLKRREPHHWRAATIYDICISYMYIYIYYELFIYVICIWIRFIHGWLLLLCLYMYWYVYTSPFASATWTCRKRLLGFGRTMSAVLHRPGLGKAAVLRVFFQCSHLFSSAGHHFFAGDVDKASMCHLFVHINTTSCHSPIPKIPVWEDDDRQIMENPLV
jgi:hypothetical protein